MCAKSLEQMPGALFAQCGRVETVEEWITERRTTWERRLDRLADYLAAESGPPDEGDSK